MPYRKKSKYVGRRSTIFRTQRGKIHQGSYGTHSFTRGMTPQYGKFKLKGVLDIATSGATSFNYGLRITQPDAFDASNALTDWSSIVSLYDEFRVTGIKIKFIPGRPNDTSSTVSNYAPVYTFVDYDSVGLTPTVAQIVGYDNMQVHNLYRPWKRYIKVPKLINTSGTTVARPGWMDTANPTSTGAFYVNCQGLASSTIDFGNLIVTYYIVTHNRK